MCMWLNAVFATRVSISRVSISPWKFSFDKYLFVNEVAVGVGKANIPAFSKTAYKLL